MSCNDETGKITKQIISKLKKGEDIEALKILRQYDKFLCLKSMKKILSSCIRCIITIETFIFLAYASSHRHDLEIFTIETLEKM